MRYLPINNMECNILHVMPKHQSHKNIKIINPPISHGTSRDCIKFEHYRLNSVDLKLEQSQGGEF